MGNAVWASKTGRTKTVLPVTRVGVVHFPLLQKIKQIILRVANNLSSKVNPIRNISNKRMQQKLRFDLRSHVAFFFLVAVSTNRYDILYVNILRVLLISILKHGKLSTSFTRISCFWSFLNNKFPLFRLHIYPCHSSTSSDCRYKSSSSAVSVLSSFSFAFGSATD